MSRSVLFAKEGFECDSIRGGSSKGQNRWSYVGNQRSFCRSVNWCDLIHATAIRVRPYALIRLKKQMCLPLTLSELREVLGIASKQHTEIGDG